MSSARKADVIRVDTVDSVDTKALCDLYDAVGWSTYTRDMESLRAAIAGSDLVVVVQQEGKLIGLARAISDDSSIAYIQDILVAPPHQGRGVGRALVMAILERYAHVRQKVLLTDDRPGQLGFYASLGFRNTRDLRETPLNAFVIIEGATLL